MLRVFCNTPQGQRVGRGGEKRGRRRDFLPVPPTALFLCTAHLVREQLSRFLPLIIVNTWTFLNGPGPANLMAV